MFKENSPSYRIMALICMCGECSEKALSILIADEPNRNKLITSLITKKLIIRYQKNELVGFRLTRNAKKMILLTASERFGFFLENGADYSMRRASIPYRLRQHRISETLAMMERAEIETYRNSKYNIFEKVLDQAKELSSSAFYLPKEIKTQQKPIQKIINSKMTGLWITEDAARLCYQSSKEFLKQFNNIEHRAETLIHSKLQTSGLDINCCDAILFGNTMEPVKTYLNNSLIQNYIQRSPFRRFCYIPMDENGIMLLKLLNSPNLYNHLLTILAEDLHPKEDSYLLNDGFTKNGLPTLICIDCDLKRLATFRTQLNYSGKSGEVICFDFQKDSMKEIFGKNIYIATIDSNIIRKLILIN